MKNKDFWAVWRPAKITKHLRDRLGRKSLDGEWAIAGVVQRAKVITTSLMSTTDGMQVELVIDLDKPDGKKRLNELWEMFECSI